MTAPNRQSIAEAERRVFKEECAEVLLATQNVLVNHEVVRAKTLMSAGLAYDSADAI